jgi:predicted dehydrogenase
MTDEPPASPAASVGIAVIGTGFGCITHVPALRQAGFDVVALVGRDPARTAERAERFGIPHACTDLDEALSLEAVAAVSVATPPRTHGPIVLRAVEAGKHVLCEKPFASDAIEARTMLAAADSAGVVHVLGTEFRWATGQAMMARAVKAGAIGSPRLATFLLHIPLLADPASVVPEWWSSAAAGGGWLGAHASHVVDQIRTTIGEFEGVSAALPVPTGHGWTAEDTYSVRFRLQGGVEGVMQATAGDWGPILILNRVSGSTGTVWAEGDRVQVADAGGTRTLEPDADLVPGAAQPPPADLLHTEYDMLHSMGIDVGPYTRLAVAFRDRILGRPTADDPPVPTFADGVAGMEVLDAIRRSAAEQRWVSIAEI